MTLGAAIGELGWGYVLIGVVVFVVVIVGALRWIASYAPTAPAETVNRSTPEPAPRPPLGTGMAYWLGSVIGAFRAGYADQFYVEDARADPLPDAIVEDRATTATTPQQRIAMPQTDSNDPLLLAKVQTLAILVQANKIGQTDGILKVFGERAGSSNPRYLLIRDLLQKELTRIQPGPRVLEPDGSRSPLTYPITGRA